MGNIVNCEFWDCFFKYLGVTLTLEIYKVIIIPNERVLLVNHKKLKRKRWKIYSGKNQTKIIANKRLL